MKETITIRPVREEDYPVVAQLIGQLHYFHADHRPDVFLTQGFHYDREREFLPLLRDRGTIALLAQAEDRSVGLCLANVRDREDHSLGVWREAHIADLMVLPQYRRRGIARMLMDAVEQRAKAMGAQKLNLTLWHFNDDARALYESLGYENLWSWMEKKI